MKQTSIKLILFLGIVSLFADITYEGARGILGPYLLLLSASGAAVGAIVGFGELAGYALRGVSGLLADKIKSYWTLNFISYIVNLISVPLLALTSHWPAAAFLVILERIGKSIRVPPRERCSHLLRKKRAGDGVLASTKRSIRSAPRSDLFLWQPISIFRGAIS